MGKKFSELERAVGLNNGDLAAFAQVDQSAPTGYKSKSAPMSLVSQKILKDTEYASDLQTDDKTVLGAINEVNSRTIAHDVVSGPIANFKTSLELPIESLGIDVNAVQESGTPTPAAPLPISGRSEITLVNCGANLCNQTDIVGAYPTKYTVDIDGSIKTVGNLGLADVLWTNTSKVSGVLNVIFVSKYQNTGSVGIRPKIIYTDGTNSVIYTTNTQDYSVNTLLTTSSKTVEKIVVDYGTNNPTNFFLEVTLDTSASTYEPFNGNTEVINLGGTYYGGHLTQDKDGHRQFEVTHKYELLNDESLWQNTTGTVTYFYNYAFTDRKLFGTSTEGVICSAYPIGSSNGSARWQSATGYRFGINDNTVTLDDIKALARNGDIAIVYELAVPIIIDLSDGDPIITLNGTNNIYADSGDASVEYALTIEEYIDNKIASVQALILNS